MRWGGLERRGFPRSVIDNLMKSTLKKTSPDMCNVLSQNDVSNLDTDGEQSIKVAGALKQYSRKYGQLCS